MHRYFLFKGHGVDICICLSRVQLAGDSQKKRCLSLKVFSFCSNTSAMDYTSAENKGGNNWQNVTFWTISIRVDGSRLE